MNQQNTTDSPKSSEQALINTLRYIEHAAAAAWDNESKRQYNVEFNTQRLLHQQAHLKVRNVLLSHLRDKLEFVAETVAQLRCSTDPELMAARCGRDTIIGEGVSSVSYTVAVSVALDHASVAMISLVRELAKSDSSNP